LAVGFCYFPLFFPGLVVGLGYLIFPGLVVGFRYFCLFFPVWQLVLVIFA
jgi:hypothetical protein